MSQHNGTGRPEDNRSADNIAVEPDNKDPGSGETPGLLYWRERILFTMYLVGAVLGGLAYIPGLYYLIWMGHWDVALFDGLSLSWLILALVLRKRLGFKVRAVTALSLMFTVGVLVLIRLGPYSGGPVWLFSFAVASGILLGLRGAITALLANAVTLFILGYFLTQGAFTWGASWDFPLGRWVVTSLNLFLLNATVAMSIAALARGLEATLLKERSAHFALGRERIQLEKTNEQLKLEATERHRVEEALRESEERYRVLVETTSDWVWEMDRDGTYTYSGPKVKDLLGYAPEEVIGRTYLDLLPADENVESIDLMTTLLEAGQPIVNAESVFLHKEGRAVIIEISGVPLFINSGQLVGCRGMGRDITQRKRWEKAVKESEERYRNLVETSPVGILVHNQENIVFVNPQANKILGGQSSDDLVGRPIWDIIPKEFHIQAGEWIRSLFIEKREITISGTKLCRLDGEVIHIEGATHPVDYLDKPSAQMTFLDISRRIRVEEALKDSERRYRKLFNSIRDFVYSHDFHGRITDINPVTAEKLGYSPEEIIGRLISDFVSPKYREDFWKEYAAQTEKRKPMEGLIQLSTKAGEKLYIEYLSNIVYHDGQPSHVTGSARDVTERIIAQRKLMRMEEQLAHSQKMEAIGILASGIAHDFNNILQAVTGYIELMQKKADRPDKISVYLHEVDTTVQRAAELVQRLLTFSRKGETRLEPLDLNEEVIQSAKILTRTIPKMIDIELQMAEDLKMINADAHQLEQVLLNLGANAKDAMPDGGKLLLKTENISIDAEDSRPHTELAPGDYVLLTVSDTGCGMGEEILEHLFEPFFTTKGVGEGTGLGLSTVYGIVKGHSGIATCESQTGRGTTFRIYLPGLKDETTGPAETIAPKKDHLGGNESILLVDDEKAIRETAGEILAGHGYRVCTAESGEEALKVYEEKAESIDLLILDLGMPGMGGHACLKEILKKNPEAKVIIASGYSAGQHARTNIHSGAKDFIGKPYRLTDMLKKVRDVLDD